MFRNHPLNIVIELKNVTAIGINSKLGLPNNVSISLG